MTDSWPALQTSRVPGGTRGTGPNSSSKLTVVKGSLLTFTYFWMPACKHFLGPFRRAPFLCVMPSVHNAAVGMTTGCWCWGSRCRWKWRVKMWNFHSPNVKMRVKCQIHICTDPGRQKDVLLLQVWLYFNEYWLKSGRKIRMFRESKQHLETLYHVLSPPWQ